MQTDAPTGIRPATFRKAERLCSQKTLDALFGGGNKSCTAYPIRAIFMPTPEAGVRVLISVSKRYFKRAVKRNRIKRQLREAYRLQKHLITPSADGGLAIAFLWTSAEQLPTDEVMRKMKSLLLRINDTSIP